MNNKKSRLFLWVSFAIFAISIIALLLNIIGTYYKIKTEFPNDDIRVMNEFGFGLIVGMWFMFPFLGSELSFIRSVYKILKHKPNGFVKICYIVSSCLAFLTFVFYCLVNAGLISFENIWDKPNATVTVLLFTEWPGFILSFVLGSIPIKHHD